MNGWSAAYARLPGNMRGALWMVLSAISFTLMTMLIKYLGADYSPALQAFYRQAAGLIVLAPIIIRDPIGSFRTTRPWILIFRSSAGVIGLILSFYAYQEMPLADANALSFTRTLWMVPLAAFVLREKIGPVRVAATLVGFAGALIMIRPSGDHALSLPALAALASAFLFSLTVTGMKVMTRDHAPIVLLVWAAALGFVFTLPPALAVWRWPAPADLALLAVMGVFGTITQGAYIKGMQLGDAAVMTPVDYTRLIFAVALGFALFHETPSAVTMIGAAIIIVSTLYITVREARENAALVEEEGLGERS
ncbi:MAG TPA: DMT family transporter [Caulobacterales bacterium]|nr:DMT family transporter [Caulobacterales bacterium]